MIEIIDDGVINAVDRALDSGGEHKNVVPFMKL